MINIRNVRDMNTILQKLQLPDEFPVVQAKGLLVFTGVPADVLTSPDPDQREIEEARIPLFQYVGPFSIANEPYGRSNKHRIYDVGALGDTGFATRFYTDVEDRWEFSSGSRYLVIPTAWGFDHGEVRICPCQRIPNPRLR